MAVLYLLIQVLVLRFPKYCKDTNFIRRALKSNYLSSVYVVLYTCLDKYVEPKVVALHFLN